MFAFNFYSIILIFFGSVTLLMSHYVYKKEGEAVRLFGLMMLANAIWSIGYGFELASSTPGQILFFNDIEFLGITTLPLTWFLFCLNISGKDSWYKKRSNMAILLSITIVTMLLVWTNEYHHIYFKNYTIDHSGGFPVAKFEGGILYFLFTAYFYILLALGNYLLFAKFRAADAMYRRQNYLIMIASLIPWIANISFVTGISPLGNIDITPFAFIATVLFISIAIYRFQLFDIVPVAREKVMDLIQDGFVILDGKHRIIDHNLAFRKYAIPLKNDKIIGMTIHDVLPGQPDFMGFIEKHKSGNFELEVKTQHGTFDLEADVRYLNENKLNSEAIIIKLQDYTSFKKGVQHSKEQTEELQRLNQLKDRIFSIIAHDLRAPLVNLSEVLKMISHDELNAEEFKALAPTLSKDIIYTTDLLENILHWSRSQLKGYGINKEFFDLKGLIVNEVNYHLPTAEAKQVTIVQDVFPGETVYADILMIQIVVRNILNNAIKFCHEGCEIHISAVYDKNHMMLLRIKDNGVGMPEEALQHLFDGENYSTRGTKNEKGTGLGLVVCKDFIERNDGKISATSTLNEGSEFCIHIPVDAK